MEPLLVIEIRAASDGGYYIRTETHAGGPTEFKWVATKVVGPLDDAAWVDDVARGLVGFHEAGSLGFVSAVTDWRQ